jgi:RND family efflux transporter MFP subunit
MRLFLRLTLSMMLGLTLAACGEDAPAPAAPPAAKAVGLAPASAVVLPLRATAPAQVVSGNASELSADVSARVARVHADVGSTVQAGGLILALDPADYRLALAQAQAQLASARANANLLEQRVRRAEALVEQRFVSEDELLALRSERDAARAQVDIATANRQVAARNVEKTRITAPFDGVVVERFAQVGTLAAAGSPLLRFVQVGGLEVQADVQTSDAQSLRLATRIVLQTRDGEHPLRLLRLAPVVDPGARSQVARLDFEGSPAVAGTSGTLAWTSPGQRLPANLLVKREQALGYFIARDGRAAFVPVPGAQQGRAFDVRLEPDVSLVVRGQNALEHGDQVRAAPEGGEPASEQPASEADAG